MPTRATWVVRIPSSGQIPSSYFCGHDAGRTNAIRQGCHHGQQPLCVLSALMEGVSAQLAQYAACLVRTLLRPNPPKRRGCATCLGSHTSGVIWQLAHEQRHTPSSWPAMNCSVNSGLTTRLEVLCNNNVHALQNIDAFQECLVHKFFLSEITCGDLCVVLTGD